MSLALIVILMWQCMMKNQWITYSNLCFGSIFMMIWLHFGFTAMKMQIIVWIISTSGKIRFTMQIENKNGLKYLDFRFKSKGKKTTVYVYSKPTNINICRPKDLLPLQKNKQNTWRYCSSVKEHLWLRWKVWKMM